MDCQCVVDYELLLEYFKVVMSFPTITLVIFGIFFWNFRSELRNLLGRMRNLEAAGTKMAFDPEQLANKVADATLEPKREEILKMEEGDAKQERIAALEAETKALQARLLSAFTTERFDILDLIRDKDLLRALDNILWYPRGLIVSSDTTDDQIMMLLNKAYTDYSQETLRKVIRLARLEAGINKQILESSK